MSIGSVVLPRPPVVTEGLDRLVSLEPRAAPAAIARRLDVKPGTVCQTLDQVMYAGGIAVQWGTVWLLPEHYRLQVRRHATRTAPVVRTSGS